MRSKAAGRARALLVAATVVTLVGCATTLREEARRAMESPAVDPLPVVATLEAMWDSIAPTKRIFGVTLVEGRRRFGGEGAVTFATDPRWLEAHVFGPHDTPILHVTLDEDLLTVRLPRENETLVGELGDPRFARLTGERALVSPEILGAMIGAYDVERMIEGSERVVAAGDDGRRTLYILEDGRVHALTIATPTGPLVEYRQDRDDRPVYRVRFEEFEETGGRGSPRRIVLRDFVGDRYLVIDVKSEREASEHEIGND
ncbi:MAG: hypothetical protein R3326_09975 [Gemmatimonadota bacterium]|nr:hypothetical protein [Gemmatimonadota bacterium]